MAHPFDAYWRKTRDGPGENDVGDNTRDASGPLAILVVHGIGAQERGETPRKLMAGLARTDPTLDSSRFDGVITVGGRSVRLYEVYWADEVKGEVTRGAFQMTELQSLAWFPWFNYRCG